MIKFILKYKLCTTWEYTLCCQISHKIVKEIELSKKSLNFFRIWFCVERVAKGVLKEVD
jgi:hypothetical protein